MAKIYQHSVGINLAVATDIDLTGATVTELEVKKPSGKLVTWPVTINGLDPKQLDYVTLVNDLDEVGGYYIQANVALGGKILFGETVKLEIYGPFQ